MTIIPYYHKNTIVLPAGPAFLCDWSQALC